MKSSLLAIVFLLSAAFVSAAEQRPYTEGPVTQVSYIKIKPGMMETYMKWVATERKTLLDEQKKAGIILEYRIYTAQARTPQDADLILTVTYKNMAALDGLAERTDSIRDKIYGSQAKAEKAAVSREEMREVMGTELIRELVLR